MVYRFKQFFSALSAQINKDDHQLIKEYLSAKEQDLFCAMDIPTQYHSIRVAKSALLLMNRYQEIDARSLLKGALLHDIGKPAGHLTTILRCLIVLTNRLNPNLAHNLARPGRGNWWANLRNGLYIHFNHPRLGGELAQKTGVDSQVITLIENHHWPAGSEDSVELVILREADNLN